MLSGLDIALTPTQTKILTWVISILTLVVTGLIFYRAAGVQGWQHDVSWHTLNGLQTLRTHVISMTDTHSMDLPPLRLVWGTFDSRSYHGTAHGQLVEVRTCIPIGNRAHSTSLTHILGINNLS